MCVWEGTGTGSKLGYPDIWNESNSVYSYIGVGRGSRFSSLIETFSRNRKSVDNLSSEAVVIFKSDRGRGRSREAGGDQDTKKLCNTIGW